MKKTQNDSTKMEINFIRSPLRQLLTNQLAGSKAPDQPFTVSASSASSAGPSHVGKQQLSLFPPPPRDCRFLLPSAVTYTDRLAVTHAARTRALSVVRWVDRVLLNEESPCL